MKANLYHLAEVYGNVLMKGYESGFLNEILTGNSMELAPAKNTLDITIKDKELFEFENFHDYILSLSKWKIHDMLNNRFVCLVRFPMKRRTYVETGKLDNESYMAFKRPLTGDYVAYFLHNLKGDESLPEGSSMLSFSDKDYFGDFMKEFSRLSGESAMIDTKDHG